jgi:hypothetical protein
VSHALEHLSLCVPRTRFNLLIAFAPCLWLLAIRPAPAQTFKVHYYFKGAPDGTAPFGGFILDESGNIYGTTQAGGVSYNGTAFRLNSSGKEAVLYNFRAGYGDGPNSPLVRDDQGTIYGTTLYGGAVFKLDSKGNEMYCTASPFFRMDVGQMPSFGMRRAFCLAPLM